MRVFLLFIFIPSLAFCQVLDNREGQAFTDEPFFNAAFIKENRIKRIEGSYKYKKKGDIIRETEYKLVYQFNKEGRLISEYETRADDGSEDTSWVYYRYDSRGNLITRRKTDHEGFATVHYKYDSLDRVIAEEYVREIDSTADQPARKLTFNRERIEYQNFDRQEKRTRYNNYNLPYLDEYVNYNELGYLTEKVERIKMTSDVYTFAHEYNREGKLSAIRKMSNKKDGYLEEFEFKYDELGNIIEKHVTKKDVFTTDIQIVYNSKTRLLSSVITRQVSTGFITIVRFDNYEFF